jgi:hypothetical protein
MLIKSQQPGMRAQPVTGDWSKLVSALNQLPTSTSTSACNGNGSPDARMYELLFGYADGPSVLVRVFTDCTPAVDNGSLQANDPGTIVPLITALL